jgi:hypothetical protein
MHVIFTADTIIHIFAVMIELLHAAIASFAVIAVFMYIHATTITPN